MQFSTISEEASQILAENRRVLSGQQFTVPGGKYSSQLFLESCLASIILRRFDTKSAEKEITALLSTQLPDGKIAKEPRKIPLTAPPLIAYSALEVFQTSRNKEFLEKVFPRLDKFYKWLSVVRDPYSQNLISIIHPDESGYMESMAWETYKKSLDNLDLSYKNIDFNDTLFLQRGYFDVKDIFFNCVYLESLKSMAEISKILERKDIFFYAKKYEDTHNAITKHLYEKEKNLFFSLDRSGNKIEILTPVIFMPLFSKLLSFSQAKSLVNAYLHNHQQFWTDYPVPTLSFSEKGFDSVKYWKGSSTVRMNWFIFKGLMNYGLIETAEDLYEKTLDMISKSGFFEHYNSITGEGLGQSRYTSSCLVLDMEKELSLRY